MKRVISFTLCVVLLLTLASCGESKKPSSSSKPSISVLKNFSFTDNGKSVLMIYMIGSDLESRTAAATEDLAEIQKSGINLDKNEVIVYSGGSTNWHNDYADKEKNVILKLGH